MTPTPPPDSWKSGEAYQRYVGRWSVIVADRFVRWLDPSAGKKWLDIGCGTGSLSRTILGLASPAGVSGVDPSESHVTFARTAITDPRAVFSVGEANHLPFPADAFDYVVSGLVLNFIPDPAGGLQEMKRITKDGGTIAAYVWDYAGKMEFMRSFWDAAVNLDPNAAALDEGKRFPLCNPEPLNDLFTAAGLRETEVCPIDIPTRFEHFDDYWLPFLGGQGPAPGYAMSLTKERRALLRERIRSALPVADDGSISLTARAWGVRGRKP